MRVPRIVPRMERLNYINRLKGLNITGMHFILSIHPLVYSHLFPVVSRTHQAWISGRVVAPPSHSAGIVCSVLTLISWM